MASSAPTSTHLPAPTTSSRLGPVAIFLALQLGALLLPALQVPLSDEYPRPPERTALHTLLVAQVLIASVFFSTLFPSVRAAVAVVACAWPFTLLAGILASAPPSRVALAAAYASAWMALLAAWRLLLPATRRWLLASTLLATTWTLLPPALGYLHAEFGGALTAEMPVSPDRLSGGSPPAPAAPATPPRPRDPLAGALQLLDSPGTSAAPWHPLLLGATGAASALAARGAWWWRRRRK